jgi:CBS domain containing-hemolysin-like protein
MPDVPQVLLGLLAIMTLVLANGFFVAAEFSLVTVRKTRIDQLIAEGSATARVVRRALGDPDSYIAATQLGITMTSLGLGWIGEPALAVVLEPGLAAMVGDRMAVATSHSIAFTVAFAIITALHIVLGELAPKTVALQHPERTSLIVARPTELFMRVFWPFISLLNGMGRTVVQAFGLRGPSGHSLVHSEEELKMLVTASQEAGIIEEDEEQMLHRVFGFADLTAGQVMVPRTEMVAVADDAPMEFETIPADTLLGEMRARNTPLAIVIDEYGGTAGLVTFAGLMERIVGSLGQEGSAGRITVLADGSALVDGLALVTDINAQFGLHIDEDVYNTLGGYVLGRLGRRARLGDRIEVEGRTMRVEALDGLRVARVFISKRRAEHA